MEMEGCLGFAALFVAVRGRSLTAQESEALMQLDQDALNDWVRTQVAASNGAFWCEDRLGTDGRVYAAFGRVLS